MFRVSFAYSVLHRESLAPSSNRATSIHWVSGEAKQASFHPPLKLLVTFLGARGSVAFLLQRPPGSQVFRAAEVCTQTRTPKALAQPNGVDEKLLAYFVARIVAAYHSSSLRRSKNRLSFYGAGGRKWFWLLAQPRPSMQGAWKRKQNFSNECKTWSNYAGPSVVGCRSLPPLFLAQPSV